MANERNVDKVLKTLSIDRLLAKAVIKKFRRKEDGTETLPSFIRALTEATMDVKLTVEDYEAAAREAKEALDRRNEKRNRKAR